ncbi:hypothetical protein ACLBWP_14425 [Microbacterium sp. M1A1_1b]
MSSFRHPVGPQKPGVYWRRRLTVLGIIAVVVIVVVLIVVGRGNGAPAAAPSPSASARTSSAAAAPAASASSAPSSGTSGDATPAPSATADPGGADGSTCAKGQITLKPVLDKSTYGPTEDPKIAMSIENTGSKSCHLDLGSAQQVLTISSGEEQYWSSKDCQTGGTNQDVTIKAGQTLTTPAIAWDRTRSSTSTCDSSRPSVTGGGASYHLSVSVGNITSTDSAQFILN